MVVILMYVIFFLVGGFESKGVKVVFFQKSGGGDIFASYKLRKRLLVDFEVFLV